MIAMASVHELLPHKAGERRLRVWVADHEVYQRNRRLLNFTMAAKELARLRAHLKSWPVVLCMH